MKDHGFSVNSFEEYEYNQVFAGRNWNNGEVVELVLRRPGGSFAPVSYLMSTLCHELAHISHMNHGPAFQALWFKLRQEVATLQQKGYYGDGYWSSGNRLADSVQMSGNEYIGGEEVPEYVCGGAQGRTRPTGMRRRARRQIKGPSSHTGAQTERRRKAGSRVAGKDKFLGESSALDSAGKDAAGSGFGKQAGSKRAREERALAAERRMRALQAASLTSEKSEAGSSNDDEERDGDDDNDDETDEWRRKLLLESMGSGDLDDLKSDKVNLRDHGFTPASAAAGPSRRQDKETPLFLSDLEDDERSQSRPRISTVAPSSRRKQAPLFLPDSVDAVENLRNPEPSTSKPRPTAGIKRDDGEKLGTKRKRLPSPEVLDISDDDSAGELRQKDKGKARATPALKRPPKKPSPEPSQELVRQDSDLLYPSEPSEPGDWGVPSLPKVRGRMNILQEEIERRKKEGSGFRARGRQLDPLHTVRQDDKQKRFERQTARRTDYRTPEGAKESANDPLEVDLKSDVNFGMPPKDGSGQRNGRWSPSALVANEWTCQICTLTNMPLHLACAACGMPKGEREYPY